MTYGGEGLELRTLGRTGLRVTPLCAGTSPPGNTPLPYQREVPLAAAALQFSLREPPIVSTVVGPRARSESTRCSSWPGVRSRSSSGTS